MNYDEIIQSALKEVEDSDASEKLEQVRIKYFGHYGISIAETSPKPIYCTILRNPVDRSISLYNHFLRDKKSAYHNLALKGFSTFMRTQLLEVESPNHKMCQNMSATICR